MIRFLIRTGIFLASAALGLWIASLILDDFNLELSGFIVAVLVFAILQSILAPWIASITRDHASALTGAAGLVSTFLALLIATLVGDGLTIDGVTTWVLGTVIVWLVTMLGVLLLPFVLVRKAVRESRGI
ncbi:phage holin family protein [Cellulomonas sp. JH27-2]|uniref:phage holin family protein n=1 Tax=Cellulomonas sp. JH27-2 TaxID=2774139 RepID=UPI0017850296|nr:phage holin family protein [Cellulomonas sp. JH27-2]MBD8058670.1 phage holin family protein [Cellulomonas sp. JH27-2]